MSSTHTPEIGDSRESRIERLVSALESIHDGEPAVDLLIACGSRAIPPLERMLLEGAARTIALPRCRAVRALGGLGAYSTLLAYFARRELPGDPVVLFSEDAVRSAVAHELMRWKSDETFQTLLRAAAQRTTLGIVEALGEFRRPEAIPLLFETLEDDLCRNAALDALCRTPEPARDYAILALRNKARVNLAGPAASRRRRAIAVLLRTVGISRNEWLEIGDPLLEDEDAGIVVNTAAVGFLVAPANDFPKLVRALFRVANKLNCAEEDEATQLLTQHRAAAEVVARQIVKDLDAHGAHRNWTSPTWRILWHLGLAGDGPTGHGV